MIKEERKHIYNLEYEKTSKVSVLIEADSEEGAIEILKSSNSYGHLKIVDVTLWSEGTSEPETIVGFLP